MSVPVRSWPPSSYTTRSSSASPIPCATPPWTWPSTIMGLITGPQSSTRAYRLIATRPVSGSTSTTATCTAPENVGPGGLKYTVASRPGSSPPGRPPRGSQYARRATSASVTARSGEPRTEARPSSAPPPGRGEAPGPRARVPGGGGGAGAGGPPGGGPRRRRGGAPAIIHRRQDLLERLGEIAAVVRHPARRGERVRLARDQVAPPHLGGIEPEALGHRVQEALHDEGAHGHTDAAVGAERRLVGEDGDRLVLVDRRPVRPGQDSQAAERLEGAGERVNVIGPAVGDGARAQAEEHAVTSDRHLDVHALGAGLRRRGEALPPLLYPLHPPPELAGNRGDRDILGKDVALEAEAAADVGDQDPHARRRKIEHGREGRLDDGGRLGGRPHRERLAIPVGEDTARLERRRRAPRVLERLAQNQRRVRERAIDVALAVAAAEEDTVRRERGVDRREHRERLVLHPDELASVGGDAATRRHDRGNRLAAEGEAAVSQRGPRGRREPVGLEPTLERPGERTQVVGGEDAQDAVQAARPG